MNSWRGIQNLCALDTNNIINYNVSFSIERLYNTSFITDDEPNAIEGVGVLTNCESIVIKNGTIIWLDYNSITSYETFNQLDHQMQHFALKDQG